MKFFTYKQAAQWDEYVKSFLDWDVYYLCEYSVSFMLHGDGEPLLLCFENGHARMCYVVMKKDIADCSSFKGYLPFGKYYDFETPYGYGGPLVDGEFEESSQKQFADELGAFCGEQGVVSQFIRFHPLLENQRYFSEVSENLYLRDTIYIDTSSPEIIFSNLGSKNRNMVRKAQKFEIQIIQRPIKEFEAFLEMYSETMRQNNADDYYYFNEKYFACLRDSMEANATIFYAVLGGKLVSSAICLFNERTMHYHLAGTYPEYRKLAAGNLLIFEAAIWASKMGISRLHLGGGMSDNDSLFEFKKQFNRNGRIPFYIGRTIFNKSAYGYLRWLRKQLDSSFDIDNSNLIQYRR